MHIKSKSAPSTSAAKRQLGLLELTAIRGGGTFVGNPGRLPLSDALITAPKTRFLGGQEGED